MGRFPRPPLTPELEADIGSRNYNVVAEDFARSFNLDSEGQVMDTSASSETPNRLPPQGGSGTALPLPEPYASFSNLDLLRRTAHEADEAKQTLRKAGYGVTGTGLLDTVREAIAAVAEEREACCKAVCHGCREEWPLVQASVCHLRPDGVAEACDAFAIRTRGK